MFVTADMFHGVKRFEKPTTRGQAAYYLGCVTNDFYSVLINEKFIFDWKAYCWIRSDITRFRTNGSHKKTGDTSGIPGCQLPAHWSHSYEGRYSRVTQINSQAIAPKRLQSLTAAQASAAGEWNGMEWQVESGKWKVEVATEIHGKRGRDLFSG